MGKESSRLEFLDAMRGVAAIFVVLHHTRHLIFQRAIAPSGYLAVDFFFMLSGLVVADAYARRLRGGMSFLEFARVRWVRLYPLFMLGLILGVANAFREIAFQLPEALPAVQIPISLIFGVFMLPTPGWGPLFPINVPAWSLFFEMLINLVFGIYLFKASTKALSLIIVGSAFLLLAAITFEGSLKTGDLWEKFPWALSRVTFAFGLGILISRSGVHRQRRLAQAWCAPAVIVLATLLVLSPQAALRPIYDAVVVLVFFPALIIVGAWIDLKGRIALIAEFLGTTSYAVYIMHVPVLYTFAFAMRQLHVSAVVWLPLFLVLIFTLGWLADKYFDLPARRQLDRITRRRPIPS